MTGGTIDTTDRARFDPLQRTRDYRFMTREQRTGRSVQGRMTSLSLSAGSSTGRANDAVKTVTKLPDSEKSVVAQFFLKRNVGSIDTLNIGLLDENDEPVLIPINLNTGQQGATEPITQTPALPSSGPGTLIAPVDVDIDPTGNIFVADPGSQAIKMYSANGAYVRRLTPSLGVYVRTWGTSGAANGQFNTPIGAIVIANGNVLVCDRQNNRVQEFTRDAVWVSNIAITLPIGIAGDASGNIYVSSIPGANQIQLTKYNAAHTSQWSVLVSASGSTTGWVATNGTAVWVSDSTQRKIWIRDCATGGAQGTFGAAGSGNGQFGSSSPTGIAVSTDGTRLYACDAGNTRVQYMTVSGYTLTYAGQFGGATSLANYPEESMTVPVDLEVHPLTGNVILTDNTQQNVQEWTADGVFIRRIGSSGSGVLQFFFPQGIAISPDGSRLYVVENGNSRVQQLWIETTKFNPIAVAYEPVSGVNIYALDGTTNYFHSWIYASGLFTLRHPLDPLYSYFTTGGNQVNALYKANYTPTLDGLATANWTDEGGFNQNASQSTGANQPIFRMSGVRPLNGIGGLEFDGSNDSMTSGVSVSDIDCAGVAVVYLDGAGATRVIFGGNNAGALILYYDDAGKRLILDSASVLNIGATANNSFLAGIYRVVTWSVTASTWEITIDGVSYSGSHAATLTAGRTLQIGAHAGASFWDGMIYSLAIWNSHFATAAERQLQEGIYAWTFGLQSQLVGGHPYKTVRPDVAQVADLDGGSSMLYIVDRQNKAVAAHFVSATALSFVTAFSDTGLQDPVSVESDRLGGSGVFILDQAIGIIHHNAGHPGYATLDAGFGDHGNSDGQFLTPQGIAVDKDGRLWVTDSERNDIQVFDRTYKFLGKLQGIEGVQFEGIAFHPTIGVGYVADPADGKIQLLRIPDLPVFFFPASPQFGDQFVYDGQVWVNAASGKGSIGKYASVYEEFIAGNVSTTTMFGELGWFTGGTNNGIQVNATVAHPGVVRLFYTAGLNNAAYMYYGNGSQVAWNSVYEMEWLVMCDNALQQVLVGMTDSAAAPANYVFAVAQPGTFSNQWYISRSNAGVAVSSAVGSGLVNTLGVWYRILLRKTASGEATLYIQKADGSAVGESLTVTGIPSTLLVPYCRTICITSTTIQGLNVDNFRMTFDPTFATRV